MKLVELAYFTDDVPSMAEFYQRLLGAAPVAASDGMAIFAVGDTRIFIHHRYTPASGELPPLNHIALAVPDVDSACAELAAQGMSIDIPPQDYYWGRSAYLHDPDGHLVELAQAAPASDGA